LFKNFSKQDFESFIRLRRWVVVSNLERKSVIPKNAEELRRFVEAFDSRISLLGETEGLNFVDFVADFTKLGHFRTPQPLLQLCTTARIWSTWLRSLMGCL
jgi:hypothetical protein